MGVGLLLSKEDDMDENEERGTTAEDPDDPIETEIDETLDETFPASDPPSWTLGTNHHVKSQVEERDDEGGEAE
jgi:hypothetical protein